VNIDQKIIDRLGELIERGVSVLGTQTDTRGNMKRLSGLWVDFQVAHEWAISCVSLLGRVFGKESDHYIRFNELFTHLEN